MSRASRNAARAIRAHASSLIGDADRHPVYAEVVSVDPIVCELHDADVALREGDDLLLSQSVRMYDSAHVIDVGDTLLVRRMPDDDWVATDVISTKAI